MVTIEITVKQKNKPDKKIIIENINKDAKIDYVLKLVAQNLKRICNGTFRS
jgi:hypothetical protein